MIMLDTSSKPKKTKKAKTAEPSVVLPVLTRPSRSSSRGVEKIALAGHEQTASRLRECRQRMDELDAEEKILLEEIVPAAKRARLDAEICGQFAKTVEVAVEGDDKPVQVILGDKFRKVGLEHEPALRAALKAHFDVALQRRCALSLRSSSTTLAQLQEALGDKFPAFQALVETEEYFQPGAGFGEVRARIRPTLSDTLNSALDQLVDQLQIPSVRTK